MAYRTRSARRVSRNSKRNFFATIIICILLIYASITWILPSFINGLGFIKGNIDPSEKSSTEIEVTLAPPVLNIPYEATNSAVIDIKGFATSHTKVKIFVDEQESETEADESGNFTARDIYLSLGTNNIYGKTLDEDGNESLPSKTIRLLLDTEKPTLEVFEPPDNHTIESGRSVQINGKTESNTSVFINSNQIIVSDGTFNQTLSLNEGSNTLTIKALDKASNFTEIVRIVTAK